MEALIPLVVIAIFAIIAIRVGAQALMLTGVSAEVANFQACSAFFGVGFTTAEAESMLTHPVRRRIVRDLMIAGNIGLTTSLAALVVTLVRADADRLTLIAALAGSLLALYLLARLGFVRRLVDFTIRAALRRSHVTAPEDYALLLRVHSGFSVGRIPLDANDPLAGQSLRQSHLAERGVLVLGIHRADGRYDGAPRADTAMAPGDVLVVYGTEADIQAVAHPIVPAPSP